MAIKTSEGIGKEGEALGGKYFDYPELNDGHNRVQCLRVRIRGRPTQKISW